MADISIKKTKTEKDGSETQIYVVDKSENRSPSLILNFTTKTPPFNYSYVFGWKFKVSSAFRDALDIKYTEVTIAGTTLETWTQGNTYSFKEGDTIHSQDDSIIVQVDRAISCSNGTIEVSINSETTEVISIVQKKSHQGQVRFFIHQEKEEKQYFDCTQHEFIRLLMTGEFRPLRSEEEINIFHLTRPTTINELFEVKENLLSEAAQNGEILHVIYAGGSSPGSVRQIVPVKIEGDKVRARCIKSNKTKLYLIEKIGIMTAQQI